jgi:hypothetical protein
LNLVHRGGGLFLGQHQVVCPRQDLVQTAGEQPSDMWNGIENEIAVGSIDGIQPDARVEHSHVASLADELFE